MKAFIDAWTCIINGQALTNRVGVYVTYSKSQILQIAVFFSKYAHEHTLSDSWVREAILRN